MTVYVESDFLIALIRDSDWLQTEAESALAEHGFADTLFLGRERADVVFHDRPGTDNRLPGGERTPSRSAHSRGRSTPTRASSAVTCANWRSSK